MDKLKAFLAQYNITTHTIAGGIATATLLYAEVPAFHDLVYKAFTASPRWVHEAFTAAVAIYGFYHKSGNGVPKA